MKKFLCVFLALLTAALCLPLAGCGESKITVALAGMPASLDPQVASGGAGDTVFAYLFSGLLSLDSDGLPVGDCAESFSFSSDGLTLTFKLKSGLVWTDGRPLGAADFAFAVKRLLMPQTGSPYAGQLMSIEGAQEYYGGASGEISGLSCPDELTLRVKLARPDETLIYAFAAPFLSPCCEEYFYSTNGAYGMTTAQTLANGRYTVKSRGSETVTLVKKSGAAAGLPDEISFVLSSSLTDSQLTQRLGKGSLAAAVTQDEVKSGDVQCLTVGNRSWALLVTGGDTAVGSRLARIVSLGGVGEMQRNTDVTQLLPSAVGDIYLTDPLAAVGSDSAAAKTLIGELCAELKLTSMPKIILAVPDTAEARALSDELVTLWQKNIGLFVTREYYSAAKVKSLYAEGRCDLAIMPLDYSGSVTAFYRNACALLDDAELTGQLDALSGLGISAFCYAAENLLAGSQRIYAFGQSYIYACCADSRLFYEPRFSTFEFR